MSLQSLRKRLAKPASLIEVGGFRPPDDPTVSWFGAVHLCAPGEVWPRWNDLPMAPIAQLNLREAPFLPPALEDLALITVFWADVHLMGREANGEGWLVRAYPASAEIVPLAMPPDTLVTLEDIGCEQPLKALPIRYTLLEADYPDYADLLSIESVPDGIVDAWIEQCSTNEGLKLGGWPALLQSSIEWDQWDAANPEFAFQISAVPKAGFYLRGSAIWYFGRGTGDARDVWTFDYQLT
jgi:Domain of unknown function (DUF1963)